MGIAHEMELLGAKKGDFVFIGNHIGEDLIVSDRAKQYG